MLGLKWDRLDLDAATAIMSRQVTMVDHRVVVKEQPSIIATTAQATGCMLVIADRNGLDDLPGVGGAVVASALGGASVGLVQPTMTEASAR